MDEKKKEPKINLYCDDRHGDPRRWHWDLRDPGGEIVAWSYNGYKSRVAAAKAIGQVALHLARALEIEIEKKGKTQ